MCREKHNIPRTADDALLKPCTDGTYCCSTNPEDGCARRQGVFLVNGTTTTRLPSANSSVPATSSTLPTTEYSASSLSHLQQTSDPSNKVTMGVGFGAGGSIALLGIAIEFWRRKKGQRSEIERKEEDTRIDQRTRREMALHGTRIEFDGHGRMAELVDERDIGR